MRKNCLRYTAALLLLPALAQAHPGHDAGASFMAGAAHPLLGADHLLALVAAGLLAWRMEGRARIGIVFAFPILLAAGAMSGLAGLELAITEVMIALSILVLALLALEPPRHMPAGTIILTALFAMFHGHAHGLEAAHGIAGSYFVAGLTLSSAVVLGAVISCCQRLARRVSVERQHRH
jgi:urease accessory protein